MELEFERIAASGRRLTGVDRRRTRTCGRLRVIHETGWEGTSRPQGRKRPSSQARQKLEGDSSSRRERPRATRKGQERGLVSLRKAPRLTMYTV